MAVTCFSKLIRAVATTVVATGSLTVAITPASANASTEGSDTAEYVNSAQETVATAGNSIPGVAERISLSPTADAATGMNITFRAAASGATVEYRPASNPTSVVSVPTIVTGENNGVHQFATLTNLSPATAYKYRIITADGAAGPWEEFRTAASNAERFNFIYFGDAQNGLDKEAKISAQAAFTAVPDAALVVHTGDQINNANDDEQWGQWFDAQGPTARNTPMLTALGNHELMGDVLATNFQNHFTNPTNGPEIFPETTYFVDYQGVRFITLTANDLFLSQQAAFLKQALSENPNPWSVVMFHQPIYNSTTARKSTINLNYFGDILETHDVDLVLNGHDHAYARGHRTENQGNGENTGPVYMVSSTGSKFYDTGADNKAWDGNGATRAVWAKETATYTKASVEGCTITVDSVITHQGDEAETSNGVDGAGSTLDSFTIDKCGSTKLVHENL